MNRIACSEPSPDAVQFAIAAFFITELLAPLRRCVLAGEHGRGSQIRSGLNQVVQNFNAVLLLVMPFGQKKCIRYRMHSFVMGVVFGNNLPLSVKDINS